MQRNLVKPPKRAPHLVLDGCLLIRIYLSGLEVRVSDSNAPLVRDKSESRYYS